MNVLTIEEGEPQTRINDGGKVMFEVAQTSRAVIIPARWDQKVNSNLVAARRLDLPSLVGRSAGIVHVR
jgi:hypothetical protein